MSIEHFGAPTTGAFEKSPGWLDWCQEPSKPRFHLPAGAVDAHCHVFGPGARFPYASQRKYTPCDASREQLYALRDLLGVSRNVVVQATCHGADNSAMLDAVAGAPGRARGVATVKPDITRAELQRLHDGGVRGVRFNFLKRLVDVSPHDELRQIAEKIADFGWHIVIYFEAQDLPELANLFLSLPTPLVIDHMGRPDVTAPLLGSEFTGFLKFVEAKRDAWVKISCPERLSASGPRALPGELNPYADVQPFARRTLQEFGDRVLWGTDWPHPNLKSHMPDDGVLVDYIPRVAVTAEEQHRLLVENPMRLYWPEETVPPITGD